MSVIESVPISNISKVVIEFDNNWYTATHFRNGCSKGLESRQSQDLNQIYEFVDKLKEVINGKR